MSPQPSGCILGTNWPWLEHLAYRRAEACRGLYDLFAVTIPTLTSLLESPVGRVICTTIINDEYNPGIAKHEVSKFCFEILVPVIRVGVRTQAKECRIYRSMNAEGTSKLLGLLLGNEMLAEDH